MKFDQATIDFITNLNDETLSWRKQSTGLVKSGWTPVHTTIFTDYDSPFNDNWLSINLQGKYLHRNGYWLFENSDDAMLFILRWK